MHDSDRLLADRLAAILDRMIEPLDTGGARKVALRRRRRNRTATGICVALVVGVATVFGVIRTKPNPSPKVATRPAPQNEATSSTEVQLDNGLTVSFSVSKDSPDLARIRERLQQGNADDVAHGQPPSPPGCMPAEIFTGSIVVGKHTYPIGGWAPIQSQVRIRVLDYGEDTNVVYAIARIYDDTLLSPTALMTHPTVGGPMRSLGDGWYVFASAPGTPAPWYPAGQVTARTSSGASVTENVPESNRGTRC